MWSKLECMVIFTLNSQMLSLGSQLQTGKGIGDEGYNGMLDCFRKIVRNEGAKTLYRGINAPILMEAPKR